MCLSGETPDIALDDIPVRTIQTKGGARMAIIFDMGQRLKARTLQPNGLPACSGANLDTGQG